MLRRASPRISSDRCWGEKFVLRTLHPLRLIIIGSSHSSPPAHHHHHRSFCWIDAQWLVYEYDTQHLVVQQEKQALGLEVRQFLLIFGFYRLIDCNFAYLQNWEATRRGFNFASIFSDIIFLRLNNVYNLTFVLIYFSSPSYLLYCSPCGLISPYALPLQPNVYTSLPSFHTAVLIQFFSLLLCYY